MKSYYENKIQKTLTFNINKTFIYLKFYMYKKGGGVDVPLFETKSKTCMISAHIRVTALKFGKAVALVENNMEL